MVEHHAGCELKEKTGHFCTCGADPDAATRFKSPDPLPTEYERELITIAQEECFELIEELIAALCRFGIRLSKAERFGLDQVQPDPGHTLSNRDRASVEAGQLHALLTMLCRAGVLNPGTMNTASLEKLRKLEQYMQTKPVEVPGYDQKV